MEALHHRACVQELEELAVSNRVVGFYRVFLYVMIKGIICKSVSHSLCERLLTCLSCVGGGAWQQCAGGSVVGSGGASWQQWGSRLGDPYLGV